MAEEVETGGTKKFVYDKDYQPKFTEEQRREFEEAYVKAAERRRTERRVRLMKIGVVIGMLAAIGIVVWFLIG